MLATLLPAIYERRMATSVHLGTTPERTPVGVEGLTNKNGTLTDIMPKMLHFATNNLKQSHKNRFLAQYDEIKRKT
jgi:hypothetical protein